jgi:hypothetical protein
LQYAKWVSGVSLQRSNREPLMSALGQKRTSEQVRMMSALPSKADMDQHGHDVRFVPKGDIPLSLERRTFRAWTGRSIDCCARDQEQ